MAESELRLTGGTVFLAGGPVEADLLIAGGRSGLGMLMSMFLGVADVVDGPPSGGPGGGTACR